MSTQRQMGSELVPLVGDILHGEPAPDADPMRPIDILGLFGFMLLGLAIAAYHDAVARVLIRFLGRGSALGGTHDAVETPAYRFLMSLAALAIGAWVAGGSALVLLGVLVPRPGPYPGGVATEVVALLGLGALAVLLVSRGQRAFAALSDERQGTPGMAGGIRWLAAVALAVAAAVVVAQLTLPCEAWRWPVAVALASVSLVGLWRVGPTERRFVVTPGQRGWVQLLAAAALINGVLIGVGLYC